METDKTSYTLNHAGDNIEDPNKTESYEPLDEDIAAETDKMLSKVIKDEKKSTEALQEPDELTALDEKKEAIDEKTLPPNISLKDRFMQFFDRRKPTPEPNETQNGNGINQNATEVDGETTTSNPPPKKRFLPKLQNPFAKKANNDTSIEKENENEKQENEASCSDDKKAENENINDEKKPENKFKPSIHLPKFSGLLNKFRRNPRSDDIELGNGPAGKAGLASMETLDDSTKDPWNQENGPDAVDADKAKENDDKVAEGSEEKKIPVISSIRNYKCSIDDIALIGGIILFLILVFLIIAFTFLGSTKHTQVAPIRDGKVLTVTSCGVVEGLVEDSAVAFRGIPFAKPPIDNLRFEHSQVIDDINFCWNGTLEAHNPKPECMQMTDGEIVGEEDCLTLDVITPQVRYINLMPVIVLIGANDFMGGSPGILRPSARYARYREVLYVRPHFRMNVFGFLALEALSNNSNIPSSGNYALSDIISALEWIQINIKNFGGDPNSVILFGHRTGATLVTALTSSSKASKLFSRAWVSSPSSHYPGRPLVETERENAVDFDRNFPDCEDKGCWKKVDAKTLMEKLPESWKRPASSTLPAIDEAKPREFLVLDGIILKKHPQDVWKNDLNLASKLVLGTTAHVMYDKSNLIANLTVEELRQYVEASKIGQLNLTDEAFQLYGETVQGVISMISDIRVVCPLLVLARSQKNLPFYIVSQTQGELNIADVDSDIQAILGRYTSSSPQKHRFADEIRKLFDYYVSHGKVINYSPTSFVLNIEQDAIPQSDYPNCNFWIKNQMVPHFAAVF
ncbi:CLUMA_CG017521, isoform A [Clunio marinus]|uniref:CLUMA_CG017521, isoform A n=1 Tax=Clunio marinus TaxID=568069 RepID=A0A1J1IXZ2_9DIPT|nr:CLUMA_CG017521, isoform A [Clunio marinus]